MAGEFPEYQSKVGPPTGMPAIITPVPVPTFHGVSAGYEALGKAGDAAVTLVAHLKQGQDSARTNIEMADFITKADEIGDKGVRDPDYLNSRDRTQTQAYELERDALSRIPDSMRPHAQLQMRRKTIEIGNRVDQSAWTKETDADVAALDTLSLSAQKSVANASSEVERASAIDLYHTQVGEAAARNRITQVNAVHRIALFNKSLDVADAERDGQRNPQKLIEGMGSGAYPGIVDLAERQRYVNHAQQVIDNRGVMKAGQDAQYNPVGATFTVGKLHSPATAGLIFDKGIVPIESAGKPGAISPAGALGLTQLMPGTARDMAAALNMPDVAKMTDEELRARLTSNKPEDVRLNYALGRRYWDLNVQRYDGNVWAAAAAYNAGPGTKDKPRADHWHQQAVAKYGENYTGAQLAEFVTVKETRDYLYKLGTSVGADMNGGGMTPEGRARAATSVGTVMNADLAAIKKDAIENAVNANLNFNPIKQLNEAKQPDPVELAHWLTSTKAAADLGHGPSEKLLTQYQQAEAHRPMAQQAYGTAPAVLDQVITAMEAKQRAEPSTTEEQARLETLKKVYSEQKGHAVTEPVKLLYRTGGVVPAAVPVDAYPTSQEFRAALAQRGAHAMAALQIYQGSANGLLAEEKTALKQKWESSGNEYRSHLMQSIWESMPPKAATDTIAALAGDNTTMLVIGMVAKDRRDLAATMLTGLNLDKSKLVGEKEEDVKRVLERRVQGQLYVNENMHSGAVSAAMALYYGRRAGSGELYAPMDERAIERALDDTVGHVVKRNGQLTPIAPSIGPARWDSALKNLTTPQLRDQGGAYAGDMREFSAREISENGQFLSIAPGSTRYAVRWGNRPVYRLDGTPLVIDMAQVVNTSRRLGPEVAPGAVPPPPVGSAAQAMEQRYRQWEAARQEAKQPPVPFYKPQREGTP